MIDKLKELNEEYHFANQIFHLKENDGPLSGIYFSIKDNIVTKGIETTAGSEILRRWIPKWDAHVVKVIKKLGGHLIAKTSMDAWGFGSFGVNTFNIARNAIDKERVAGGSSSGSAVLTKLAWFPHVSIAESTGGSITCPSAFNSVYGFTPTYGLISRYGLISYADSLDKIGLMAKDLELLVKVFELISGGNDFTVTGKFNGLKPYKKKIAVPKAFLEGIDKKIEKEFYKFLESLDLKWEFVDFKYLKEALASYYIIAMAEASTNLARYCGMRYGREGNWEGKTFWEYFKEIRSKYFGEEEKRRIILGTFVRMKGYSKKFYYKALIGRNLVIKEFKRILREFDLILAPSMPILPPKFKEIDKLTPLQIYLSDILTIPPNLAGLPHLSIPIDDFIGVQVIGDHFEDGKVLKFGLDVRK